MVDRSRSSSATGTGTFQRAGIACQSCRIRKVKCDAQSVSPDEACSPCRRAGQECMLDPLSDGRRRRSVNRKYVDKLQQRIETLEALNQRNQRMANGATWRPNDSRVVESGNTSITLQNSSLPNTLSASTITVEHPQSHDTNPSEPSPQRISPTSQHTLPTISASVRGKSPENTNGRSPSYYGATSHPHVTSPGEESSHNSFDEPETVDIDLDPASPHLRDDLLHSFFKYQTLWVDIVNKESFLTHQAQGVSSRWYSKFLENAILASSARLSTSKAVRALGSKYYAWAKEEALSAMTEPTPAALQGFLLLSEYEVTQGNDRPGWMFCGVACRMLSDLGLHELAGSIGTPDKANASTKESDLAYALVSACVVYEGVWTLYLGRPSSIPKSVMDVTVTRCKAGRKSDSPWLNAWVGLCVPMAEISHVLNDQSINDSDRSVSLRKLFKQVEDWYERLPPEFTYNESRLTNMDVAGYGLHTQYCKVQILLRRALARPLNTRKRRYSQTTSDWGLRTSPDDSDTIIYRYALRIARLFVTYREAFGVEKTPSIMLDNAVLAATAMIAHLSHAEGSVNEVQHDTLWLRQLIRGMETVQPHFPIIGRMLETLKQINGNSSLGNLLQSSHRGSTVAPPVREHCSPISSQFVSNPPVQTQPCQNRDQSAPSQSTDSIPIVEIPRDTMGLEETETDKLWETFDMEIDSSMFFAGGLDNFVFDLPPLDASMSTLTQAASRRRPNIIY